MTNIHLKTTIPESLNGYRLDQALVALFPQYSRAQHQTWIRNGDVILDGKTYPRRTRDKVHTEQTVEILTTLMRETDALPQAIPLNIVYEDSALLVLDKPAGLVTHPGAGNPDQTLVNALLYFDSNLKKLPRAGIIHRLDKETSGLLTVARNLEVYNRLVQAMQARKIKREYEAIVQGTLISGGKIEAPIGRHPHQRTQMAVVESGKPAITHYRIIEKFRGHTHLRIQLETGRTHQIRVHLKHIGYPIVGDPTYRKPRKLPQTMGQAAKDAVHHFPRQALHAAKLELLHPKNSRLLSLTSPLPKDIETLRDVLKRDSEH